MRRAWLAACAVAAIVAEGSPAHQRLARAAGGRGSAAPVTSAAGPGAPTYAPMAASARTYATVSGTHRIRSYDGVELQAYSVRPVAPGKKFPVLVFVNSWMCQGNEYTNVIDAWAKKGYVCLQYAARGWYLSGGKVDVGGPDNTRDATAVIDFMLREFKEQAD
eukprot:COSAG04_NODE_4213_length_2228_cov_5.153124_5_plen_162_part_01